MARKRTFIALIAAALIGLAVAARFIGRETSARPATATPAAPAAERAIPVYTHRVVPRTLREEVTATGAVRAGESIDLVSELTGKVVALHFEEGSVVERGALLVKLDDAELQAQYDRARHRVELARVQAERQRELLAGQGTSRQNYDAAVNEQRVLESEADLIRAQLLKTEIRAPFSGAVGLRYVSVGSFVSPPTRIASLQSLDELKIDFSIAERYMARITTGADIEVHVAGREAAIHGEVYAIEPQIDPATRTIRLRARAPNPGRVFPGAFATVKLIVQEVPEALLVPATALVPGLNEQRVFVVENGRAEPRVVQTGIRLAREVQISSGLTAGAEVITSGQLQLQPGSLVRPVERPARDPLSVGGIGP